MKALGLTLLFLLVAASEAKIFSRCELASVLKQNGLDKYKGQLGEWLCLAYLASNFNTQAVRGDHYGIFQIDSFDWCSNTSHPKFARCKKPCSAFIDDDITDDIACVEIIRNHIVPLTNFWPWASNCEEPDMSKWSSGCRL